MDKHNYLYTYFDRIENAIWKINRSVKYLIDIDYRKIMLENRKYKNIYKGNRCFILGNGPSLGKEKNIDLLKDEYVFTVNQLFRSEIFNRVKPNFHVMIDYLFFELNEDDPIENDTLTRMKQLKKYEDITFVFPWRFKKKIRQQGIGNKNNIYIDERFRVYDGYNMEVRLDKSIIVVGTVVQAAVLCAIYMGFSEIYILGCDLTDFLATYIKDDINEDNVDTRHIYSYTNAERERMRRLYDEGLNEQRLYYTYIQLRTFRIINEYCKKKEIKLYNIAQGSALDCLPRKNLNEVLGIENNS